jgi:hypothetical protein
VAAVVVVIAIKEVMEATLLPEVVHAKNGAALPLQLVDHKLIGGVGGIDGTYYGSSGFFGEGRSAAAYMNSSGGLWRFFEFIECYLS